MNIDFHTHANLAKKLAVSLEDFQEKIRQAKASGLTALAITEHFNAPNIIDFYETLQENFPYQQHFYNIEGMKVFCGLEIDVRENGHFLVLGPREDIFTIALSLLPYQKEGAFMPVKDLVTFLRDFNVVKIGAHPLRESNPWEHHDTSVLQQFDAFDLNGKDLYTYGPALEDRVRSFAEAYGVPVVGGSDTHHEKQYGSIINEFPETGFMDELKMAMQQGNYQTKISPMLDEKVKEAKELKKMIKASIV